jgi:cell wall-associated NlpC family hydrolase
MKRRAVATAVAAAGLLAATCQIATAAPSPSPSTTSVGSSASPAAPGSTAASPVPPTQSDTSSSAPTHSRPAGTPTPTKPSTPTPSMTTATVPPEVTAAPNDPTSVQLPKVALAALTTVPDYNVDPLLLAGLNEKLRQARSAERVVEANLTRQQGARAALGLRAQQLAQDAADARRSAAAARHQFQRSVSSNYMSSSGFSPAVDALLSPASTSPEDVMYAANVMTIYAADQGEQLAIAVREMTRAAATASDGQNAADAAEHTLLAIEQRGRAAKHATQQVQDQLTARIIEVRRDLARRQATQRVTSADALGRWKAYLEELGVYAITPPAAGQLRDLAHLPKGMDAIRNASGVKQPGIASFQSKHAKILVLPQEAITAVGFAFAQLGKPYIWASTGPAGFDCSGLTLAAYRAAGITALPRISWDQYSWTTRIKPGAEMPGDLVFFAGDDGTMTHPGHVAIVIDPIHHLMIQAPQTGDVVKVSDYSQWGGLVGFGRVTTAG